MQDELTDGSKAPVDHVTPVKIPETRRGPARENSEPPHDNNTSNPIEWDNWT